MFRGTPRTAIAFGLGSDTSLAMMAYIAAPSRVDDPEGSDAIVIMMFNSTGQIREFQDARGRPWNGMESICRHGSRFARRHLSRCGRADAAERADDQDAPSFAEGLTSARKRRL